MIEARRKQLLRDISMLQMVNLASARGKEAHETQRIFNDMLNEYYALEGIDKKREQIEANWASLKRMKRG